MSSALFSAAGKKSTTLEGTQRPATKTGSIPTKEELNIAERPMATYSSKFQVTAKFSCYQSLLGDWFKTVSLQEYKQVTVR